MVRSATGTGLPVGPHGSMARLHAGDGVDVAAIVAGHVELPGPGSVGAEDDPAAFGGRLRMVVVRARRAVREHLAAPDEPDAQQLDARTDPGRGVDRRAVGQPGGHVAAAAVEVGDVEVLDGPLVAVAVAELA